MYLQEHFSLDQEHFSTSESSLLIVPIYVSLIHVPGGGIGCRKSQARRGTSLQPGACSLGLRFSKGRSAWGRLVFCSSRVTAVVLLQTAHRPVCDKTCSKWCLAVSSISWTVEQSMIGNVALLFSKLERSSWRPDA